MPSHALPFIFKAVCTRRKPGAAAFQCYQWCFDFLLAWEPQIHLLLRPDISGSCCLLTMVTAGCKSQPVLWPSKSIGRDTSRPIRPCACNSHGTLLNGCWWLLCSARSVGEGGKNYSEGDNRNLLMLGGEEGKRAKHPRNFSKAAEIVGEGRCGDETDKVVGGIFVFNDE